MPYSLRQLCRGKTGGIPSAESQIASVVDIYHMEPASERCRQMTENPKVLDKES
jgi:hypothetical protein